MKPNKLPCDVFVSAAPSDKRLADGLAETLRQYSIVPFLPHAVDLASPGKAFADAIWEAIAECRAMVLLIGPSGITNWMLVEVGAVRAWNKPIYCVLADSKTEPPTQLGPLLVYTMSGLDDLIVAIQRSQTGYDDEEQRTLISIFGERGISVEDLSFSSFELEQITEKFNGTLHKNATPERLLMELIRLRKRGVLPRIRARRTVA